MSEVAVVYNSWVHGNRTRSPSSRMDREDGLVSQGLKRLAWQNRNGLRPMVDDGHDPMELDTRIVATDPQVGRFPDLFAAMMADPDAYAERDRRIAPQRHIRPSSGTAHPRRATAPVVFGAVVPLWHTPAGWRRGAGLT